MSDVSYLCKQTVSWYGPYEGDQYVCRMEDAVKPAEAVNNSAVGGQSSSCLCRTHVLGVQSSKYY